MEVTAHMAIFEIFSYRMIIMITHRQSVRASTTQSLKYLCIRT